MTSKENVADAATILLVRERGVLHDVIRAGRLPTLDDLIAGAPFFADNIERDIQAWCDSLPTIGLYRYDEHGAAVPIVPTLELRNAVSVLRDTCAPLAVEAVRLELSGISHEDEWRMRVYQSCMLTSGDSTRPAREALALYIAERAVSRSRNLDFWHHCVVAGLLGRQQTSMQNYCKHGYNEIARFSDVQDDIGLARVIIAAADKKAAETGAAPTFEDIAAAAQRDEPGEEDWQEAIEETRAAEPAAVIVVPELPDGQTSHRKDIFRGWKDIAGEPLPLVAKGDIAAARRHLMLQWPHAIDVIDTILGDLVTRDDVRFRPTLLVGEPGSGKSSLARAICDELGLPCELFSLGGVADAALGGTSAQWSTARESVPLQLIKRAKTASGAVIWDEVEKAVTGSANGAALDALLPLLELDQARRFRDPALEVECDLSFVSHFATANSVDGIPAPLRDRMRILRMPTPSWAHLGVLSGQIVDRIARERGIDRRWFQPLAEDELDLVRAAWPGGSIRKLTRIIQTVLDGRETIMGRC
ncbi:AAA family ATPase [Devosia sp. SD17-2]|jgi:hypothetical protein|uniref:AAA family ATPase n=1 Tax=Devosia sp. SD17-2 TaxID=2976459 RepID=UPI0023D808EE|nr:AAA family ATPase [Devosia sp. SD17-2]WEJ32749.1 AAA family ATPase [Devosia sp. SD17-2]